METLQGPFVSGFLGGVMGGSSVLLSIRRLEGMSIHDELACQYTPGGVAGFLSIRLLQGGK